MKNKNLFPFILITSLFLMWGLANNMTDTLLSAFKRIMSMTDFQTSFVQMAFYGAYFCFALPAAILIKKYTYKTGILFGLALFIIGSLLFYPASLTMQYGHFLAALYILASGLSFLETSANPYVLFLGPEENATQRLNLAQAFNPIGSITGVLLSQVFILSELNSASEAERMAMSAEQLKTIQSNELAAVMGPYVGVAFILVLIWILIAITKMPPVKDDKELHLKATFNRLIKKKNYVWSVVAQFFYVGAQIGVWSFTIRYVMAELGLDEAGAASYYLAALVLFTISRFICTYLMKFISPGRLLTILAGIAIFCTAIVALSGGMVGVIALVGISGCMSLMFPTIYGLGLRGLGRDAKIGGAGLIMAILGGALITPAQGYISTITGSIKVAFLVPLLCFVFVGYYGIISEKFKLPQRI